jgi:hypothetical protein
LANGLHVKTREFAFCALHIFPSALESSAR